jgi:hypothetical protein
VEVEGAPDPGVATAKPLYRPDRTTRFGESTTHGAAAPSLARSACTAPTVSGNLVSAAGASVPPELSANAGTALVTGTSLGVPVLDVVTLSGPEPWRADGVTLDPHPETTVAISAPVRKADGRNLEMSVMFFLRLDIL